MLLRNILLAAFLLLPLGVSAATQHLTHDELMALPPTPDVRPTYDPTTKDYVSGGIGILVYDGVNAMDVLGPYQVFSTAGLRPLLISASRDSSGSYKTSITTNSRLTLSAHRTIADTQNLELLVVTGGALETALMAQDPDLLNWIKAIDRNTVWTTSVCTGSWILGASGLLQGKKATSNWYKADRLLAHFGAIPKSKQRYIFDGKIVTAAGVTAGIDMALALVKKLYAADLNNGKDFTQAVMLDLQYDPQPPVSGGSPGKTDPYVYEGMDMMYDMYGDFIAMMFPPFTGTLADYVELIPIQ